LNSAVFGKEKCRWVSLAEKLFCGKIKKVKKGQGKDISKKLKFDVIPARIFVSPDPI